MGGKYKDFWKNNIISNWPRWYWIISAVLLPLFLISLFFSPYFFIKWTFLDFSNTGEIGDTIAGTTAPIIGFFAVLTTFIAFIVQFQANQAQRRDIARERFENKFYTMLELHRQNVSELEISGRHIGRKAFVKMYHEYRFLYLLLEKICKDRGCSITRNTRLRLCKIVYHHFFFGVDFETKPKYEKEKSSIEEVLLNEIRKIQANFWIHKERCLKNNWTLPNHPFFTEINSKNQLNPSGQKLIEKELEIDFYPFDGHVSKLGHYYRHLYQTVKYVISQGSKIGLNWKDRYAYIKMIRAQLSNHEQTMIYFNSFWILKEVWWGEFIDNQVVSIFKDYALIKNLPFDLTKGYGPDPESEFTIRMGKGPYIIDADEPVVSLKKKLDWLFEWRGG